MQTLDLSTSLSPVINLSEKTTAEAFAEACGTPLTRVLIENLQPYAGPVSIPVRVIDGMEKIAERGTAASERQFALISALAALIGESSLCKA